MQCFCIRKKPKRPLLTTNHFLNHKQVPRRNVSTQTRFTLPHWVPVCSQRISSILTGCDKHSTQKQADHLFQHTAEESPVRETSGRSTPRSPAALLSTCKITRLLAYPSLVPSHKRAKQLWARVPFPSETINPSLWICTHMARQRIAEVQLARYHQRLCAVCIMYIQLTHFTRTGTTNFYILCITSKWSCIRLSFYNNRLLATCINNYVRDHFQVCRCIVHELTLVLWQANWYSRTDGINSTLTIFTSHDYPGTRFKLDLPES